MSKPTPLEVILAHYQTKGPDTIDAAAIYDGAREELRVKNELCEAELAISGTPATTPVSEIILRIETAIREYRTWRAGQEGNDGE